MKHWIRILSVLLVLLMTVTVVACNDNKDIDNDSKDSEKETQREPEQETEPPITQEEIDALKADMSASIIEALGQSQGNTTGTNQNKPDNGNQTGDSNSDYAGVVEGLLGSLGSLGNGDYDYSKVIGEVLDQYIGSESTSDFIMGLIGSFIKGQVGSGESQTKDPSQTDAPETSAPGSADILKEYVAQQTAQAIADAIADRLTEIVDGTVRDAIYDSVYESMTRENGLMDNILGGLIQ